MIPAIIGRPLWFGKIKRRVAKKHLSVSLRNSSLANVKRGDLIFSCTGFNVRVAETRPYYKRVGKGFVLTDIEITTDSGGLCSLIHCGVEAPHSREDIIKSWEAKVSYWKANGDEWDFAKRYEFTTVDDLGQATIDFVGLKKKYGTENV